MASWDARLPGQRIVFAAKNHTPMDVVMWRAGETPVAGRSRWMLLIAGDRSPEFAIAAASFTNMLVLVTAVAVVGLLLAGAHCIRVRRSAGGLRT